MIEVPGTLEGLPAIQELIGDGINVNVTLLFGCDTYEKVAEADIAGLEEWIARGRDPKRVASVASFFVSRVDTLVDAMIATRLGEGTDARAQGMLRSLSGKAAIANAKVAYQCYRELFGGERWQALAGRGAQTQRLLWASTGTKNPSYRDVMYIEELIGPDTVITIPPATFDAFRDHGQPRASLVEDIDAAHAILDMLEQLGISMEQVSQTLLTEGLQLFSDAFDQLLDAVEKQSRSSSSGSRR
jgi:transaldolase / glucose-6-phosphate isomerase